MGIVQWLVIFFFLGILIIPMIAQYRQERKEKSKMEDDESLTFNINFTQVDNNAYKGMKTPELLKAILHGMGCEYMVDQEGAIITKYQGGTFRLQAHDDSSWVVIWNTSRLRVSMSHLDEVSCLQRAINTSNLEEACTAAYVIDKEKKELVVKYSWGGIFFPDMLNLREYLTLILGAFFTHHHQLLAEFKREKAKARLEKE